MNIALCQINTTVGDFDHNYDKILDNYYNCINKNADIIILNYANEKDAGFNSNTNHVYMYSKEGDYLELKKDRKDRIAYKIIDWVIK